MAVLLAVVSWFAWEPAKTPPPLARQYRDYDICLLTGEKGISTAPAKTAWDGLEAVSDRTSVRVSYVAVMGEQTAARAQQLLASQVAQRCGVIVAVGDAPAAAVAASRDRYPQVKFVVLKGSESAAEVTNQVLPMVPPKGK